jgi:endonuclease/exonuclease/phosphatase family metal-dependent hydrolase
MPTPVQTVVTVMTRNLYLGADLTSAYQALADPAGPAGVPAAVAAIFNPEPPLGAVQRTDFRVRAAGLADEVASARPDLLALQEAAAWRSTSAAGETVVSDHLAILEAELARRGLSYRRVVAADNGDVEMPSAVGITVGLTNRQAILAREDAEVEVGDVWAEPFASMLPIQTAHGTFSLARGWVAADARLRSRPFRLVATHLEVRRPPAAAEVQRRQIGELLAGPAAATTPVVMLGDFNLRPDSDTYGMLRDAGFEDAWTRANPGGPAGLTCCHRPPLTDPEDRLWGRIDLILTRGAVTARRAYVVGDEPGDFAAGLWPSDHAGVVAELELTGSEA